nr:hypothetical protein [Kineococcus radiotolerans]
MLEQALRGRVHDLLGERVGRPVAPGPAQHRQGDPLPDDGHVAAGEDRPGGLLQPPQVGGQQVGVVAGAGAVGAGDEDEQRSRRGGGHAATVDDNVQKREGI